MIVGWAKRSVPTRLPRFGRRDAWARFALPTLLIRISPAEAIEEDGGKEQQAYDDVDVIRADRLHIEDVGDAGDDEETEGAADRVADATAQDAVAADHQRGIDLEL